VAPCQRVIVEEWTTDNMPSELRQLVSSISPEARQRLSSAGAAAEARPLVAPRVLRFSPNASDSALRAGSPAWRAQLTWPSNPSATIDAALIPGSLAWRAVRSGSSAAPAACVRSRRHASCDSARTRLTQRCAPAHPPGGRN